MTFLQDEARAVLLQQIDHLLKQLSIFCRKKLDSRWSEKGNKWWSQNYDRISRKIDLGSLQIIVIFLKVDERNEYCRRRK